MISMISKSEFEAKARVPIEPKVPGPHSKQADAPVTHQGHHAINLRERSTVNCRCKHVAEGSWRSVDKQKIVDKLKIPGAVWISTHSI